MDPGIPKAQTLLDALRLTAMRRGAISREQFSHQCRIASVIEARQIPPALARRIAFQLVFKFPVGELGDATIWSAVGRLLQTEYTRLVGHVGLTDRQAIGVLPKLSARHVEDMLEEFRTVDRRISRTVFNAALEAADPREAGRRYLAEYRSVAEYLRTIDPSIARTLANATFTAGAPRKKALEHFKRFAALTAKFNDDPTFARRLAKAAFRAPDPFKAAETIIGEYDATIAELTSHGIEPHLARTLAASSQFRKSMS